MGFQYVHDPRSTEVERRLEDLKKNHSADYVKSQINSVSKPKQELLNQSIKPNNNFVKAHEERKNREEQENQHKEFLDSIDEQGYKVEKVYESEGFLRIHDPLRLYNAQDKKKLGAKVYTDVDEQYIFLKTLYYPEIRTEDYNTLIGYFSYEHKKLPSIQKFHAVLSLGALLGGFSAGNMLKFKMRSSLVFGASLAGLAYYALHQNSVKRMNVRLNQKALPIAEKYPEIKFLNVNYAKVNV